MYHNPAVAALPFTGTGTALAGAASYSWGGGWSYLFLCLALFTILNAGGALLRIAPVPRFFHRQPKQLAPQWSSRPRRRGGR